jgi:uncharacterized protein RhaS with RHS repeats
MAREQMFRFSAVTLIFLAAGAWTLSPAEARFLQVDPVAYKDDLDLYTYVRNDPVNKTDPTGKVIACDSSGASRISLCKDIASKINAVANGTYQFVNGKLQRVNDQSQGAGPHSETYSKALDAAISAKGVARIVELSDPGQKKVLDDVFGGGSTAYSNHLTSIVTEISGDAVSGYKDKRGNPLTESPEMILAHEIVGHLEPMLNGPHIEKSANAVEDENTVRRELGLPERQDEPWHGEINDRAIPLPF